MRKKIKKIKEKKKFGGSSDRLAGFAMANLLCHIINIEALKRAVYQNSPLCCMPCAIKICHLPFLNVDCAQGAQLAQHAYAVYDLRFLKVDCAHSGSEPAIYD